MEIVPTYGPSVDGVSFDLAVWNPLTYGGENSKRVGRKALSPAAVFHGKSVERVVLVQT